MFENLAKNEVKDCLQKAGFILVQAVKKTSDCEIVSFECLDFPHYPGLSVGFY